MITAKQRVLTACGFKAPDRIPRFDNFWEFSDSWREKLGEQWKLSDVAIWYPDETTFPTRAGKLKEDGGYVYEVDGWGRTIRHKRDAYFVETLEVPLSPGTDIDSIEFDSPQMDSRYLTGKNNPSVTYPALEAMEEALRIDKKRHCVFGKTGGPYLRSTFVRGETQFLMDIAGDPSLAKAIVDKVADHLIAVGLEQLRRWDLCDTGIWIYDDMAYNCGPMFSPEQFEKIFLPAYRRMIKAYKDAGAPYVLLHSDGDIRPLLDMLVEAGIDGINPLERRANMDVVKIREKYSNLILTGGMCNTNTLIKAAKEQIEAEAREIIDLGRDGGIIIGTHSVSPEVPLENFVAYHETCLTYGNFSQQQGDDK